MLENVKIIWASFERFAIRRKTRLRRPILWSEFQCILYFCVWTLFVSRSSSTIDNIYYSASDGSHNILIGTKLTELLNIEDVQLCVFSIQKAKISEIFDWICDKFIRHLHGENPWIANNSDNFHPIGEFWLPLDKTSPERFQKTFLYQYFCHEVNL